MDSFKEYNDAYSRLFDPDPATQHGGKEFAVIKPHAIMDVAAFPTMTLPLRYYCAPQTMQKWQPDGWERIVFALQPHWTNP